MMIDKCTKLLSTLIVATLVAVPVTASAQGPFEPDVEKMRTFLALMQDFFGIIESMHEVSDDPERAAIFQLYKIEELYEQRGERAQAIEVFREVLKESANPTIRNAAHLMLGEALKETGRKDEAVKVLRDALRENIRAAE